MAAATLNINAKNLYTLSHEPKITPGTIIAGIVQKKKPMKIA